MADYLTPFIREHADPVLKRMGYKRRGTEFQWVREDGKAGVVKIDRASLVVSETAVDHPGFELTYGITYPSLLRYLAEANGESRPSPGIACILLGARIPTPEPIVGQEVFPYRWLFSAENSPELLGTLLAAKLVDEVVTGIERWMDPRALVEAMDNYQAEYTPGAVAPHWAAVLALADEPDVELRDTYLRRLPETAPVRTWVEQQQSTDQSQRPAAPPASRPSGTTSLPPARSERDEGRPPAEVVVEEGCSSRAIPGLTAGSTGARATPAS